MDGAVAMHTGRSSIGFSEVARSVIAGIVASGTYLVALYGLTMPEWEVAYALILALGAFAGTALLLPRQRSLTERLATLDGGWSGDAAQAAVVIEACQQRIDRLRAASEALQEEGLRERTLGVIEGAERIVAGFFEDPSDISNSHIFERYLDAAADIAEKCAGLDDKSGGEAVEAVMARSYRALGDIEAAFGRQYERNLSNDILDLDVDLDVLTQTIKSEEPRA